MVLLMADKITISDGSNIAYFFNRNCLNVNLLKVIQKEWDKPIYKADLWDLNERAEFELLQLECDAAYEYYSKLYEYIKDKTVIYDIPIVYDIADYNNSLISDEVKAELEKTVAILQKYHKETYDYASTFDEKNF